MPIESVYNISGRGIVATGKVQQGNVKKSGQDLELFGFSKDPIRTSVSSIEMFNKIIDKGIAGDNLGILLKNVTKDNCRRGQILAAPKLLQLSQIFVADIYLLTKEEGGRHTPFFSGFQPQFFFLTADISGSIDFVPDPSAPKKEKKVQVKTEEVKTEEVKIEEVKPEEVKIEEKKPEEIKTQEKTESGETKPVEKKEEEEREMALPGDRKRIKVTLRVPMPLHVEMAFAMREGGVTIGAGRIIEVSKLEGEVVSKMEKKKRKVEVKPTPESTEKKDDKKTDKKDKKDEKKDW